MKIKSKKKVTKTLPKKEQLDEEEELLKRRTSGPSELKASNEKIEDRVTSLSKGKDLGPLTPSTSRSRIFPECQQLAKSPNRTITKVEEMPLLVCDVGRSTRL